MKGILFTENLFHKVVSGEKTQTRRLVTPQPYYREEDGKTYAAFRSRDIEGGYLIPYHLPNGQLGVLYDSIDYQKPLFPRYRIGEKIYLKEPYSHIFLSRTQSYIEYKYKHEYSDLDMIQWENKLFMHQRYARFYIKITNVRCERLQDISDADCVKEGITIDSAYDNDVRDEKILVASSHYIAAYANLIDEIYGKGTWESNPYVWVYDFKLVK